MVDRTQLALWWKLFHKDGLPTEIRLINGKQTASGYYMNFENVVKDIEYYDNRPGWQMYFILNDIDASCYDKPQHERIIEKPSSTTQASDITARRWCFIDLDPKRTKDISSTDEQLNHAKNKANEIYKFLKGQGFENIIAAVSGNGSHLLIPCALRNCEETDELIGNFLSTLRVLFEDDVVEVDQKPKDPCRLCKIYGTMARKGANTKERPHRQSYIIKYPEEVKPNDKSYFEKVASMRPADPQKYSKETNYSGDRFDVEAFLNKHGLSYTTVKTSLGTRYKLEECPFNSDHKHGDAMVFQYDTGAVEFYCFHNSCSDYHWKEFRMHFEPDAYDKKDYNEFKYKQRYYEKYRPVQEPAEIKAESAELGKKWLTLRDIKMEKDSERFSIKTGIYALDKAIGGLFEEQTTLLSGINASGKTAILNQLLLNAIQRDVPSALWSGELPAKRIKGWICQTAAGKNNVTKVEGLDKAYEVNEEVIGKIERWVDERLVIYNNNYGNNCEQIIADIIEAIEKYGLKFIVLDNLMALSLDYLVGTMNEKQKALMLKLDEIAKKYHVHILIIAHPRKEANFQLLRKESISGTSDLTNICWNLLLLHRVNDDFEKRATEFWGKERTQRLIYEGYNNIIEVAKNRDYGVENFLVGLYYEEETKRFKNSRAESMHYDWEEGIEEYHKLPDAPPTAMQPNTNFDNQGPVDSYEAQFKHDPNPDCPF